MNNRYGGEQWYNDRTDVRSTFSLSAGERLFQDHTLSLSVHGTGGRPFRPETIDLDCIERKYAAPDSSVAFFHGGLNRPLWRTPVKNKSQNNFLFAVAQLAPKQCPRGVSSSVEGAAITGCVETKGHQPGDEEWES